jgi:hypothetical protein
MQVIGIVGSKSAGKDSIGNVLVKHGFTKLSFASILKDISARLFSWPRDLLEGDTIESRTWREEVDTWWSEKLGISNFTPRVALQLMGTDILRKNLHNNIWILCVEKQLQDPAGKFVITDCRFKNEVDMIHNLNGNIIRVKRGSDPDWHPIAEEFNRTQDANLRNLLENEYKIHASERDWIGQKFDYIIENDGTLTDLKNRTEDVLIKIKFNVRKSKQSE